MGSRAATGGNGRQWEITRRIGTTGGNGRQQGAMRDNLEEIVDNCEDKDCGKQREAMGDSFVDGDYGTQRDATGGEATGRNGT